MPIQKINQSNENNYSNYEKALYSKKNYNRTVDIMRFIGGAALTYGALETCDKFSLSKKTITSTKMQKLAHSHTKYNALIGIAGGIATILFGKYLDKTMKPFYEKMYDKADQLNRVDKKAKELAKVLTENEDREKLQQKDTNIKDDEPVDKSAEILKAMKN